MKEGVCAHFHSAKKLKYMTLKFDPNEFLRNVLSRNRAAVANQHQQASTSSNGTSEASPVRTVHVMPSKRAPADDQVELRRQYAQENDEQHEEHQQQEEEVNLTVTLRNNVGDDRRHSRSRSRTPPSAVSRRDGRSPEVPRKHDSRARDKSVHSSRRRSRSRSRSMHRRSRDVRSRSRSRHSRRRSRSRSQHSYRRRDREVGGGSGRRDDYERGGRRSRRPSPPPYRSSRPRSPYRRPPPHQRRQRSRSRSPINRGPTIISFEDEMERLDRTLVVLQISGHMRNRDLKDFFEENGVGKVREAKIVKDGRSGNSKGVAYVEFADIESIEKALRMDGSKYNGVPLMVQRCESEKQLLLQQVQNGSFGNPQVINDTNLRKIYVAGLNPKLTRNEISPIFEAFGPLSFVDLQKDSDTGEFKGIATIGFRNPADAKNAVITMNGFPLADRTIRVGWVRERSGPIVLGMDFDRIDDDGPALGQINRNQLMAKLARERGVDMPGFTDLKTTPVAADVKPEVTQQPTRQMILRNMFDPKEETEVGWELEIKADVVDECSKYGAVVHAEVDSQDPDGCVYVRFDSAEACDNALQTMNGRWFAKKQISAKFLVDAIYEARFHL